MKGKVRYSELASTDLYENAEYIARDKPEAAIRWIETIEGVCGTLASDQPLQNLTEWFLELTGIDLTACPQCGSDLEVTELAPVRGGGWLTRASPVKKPPCIDSS